MSQRCNADEIGKWQEGVGINGPIKSLVGAGGIAQVSFGSIRGFLYADCAAILIFIVP